MTTSVAKPKAEGVRPVMGDKRARKREIQPSAAVGIYSSNRRVRDPYARWCGRRGAARRLPIPIMFI